MKTLLLLGALLLQDPATTVEGTVSLKKGVDPGKRKPLRIDCRDCVPLYPDGMPREEALVDDQNRVQGAFVYVKSRLEGRKFEVPKTPVLIDQIGCRFEPRVVGIQAGQALVFRNSDPHDHCIHGLPFVNREFNLGQPKGCRDLDKTFDRPEIMIKIGDNCRPWKAAWIGVLDHPYFAVTDASGKFQIKNLPPGKHTIEVWHESFRSVSREIEVPAKTVDLELAEKKVAVR